jgi:phospholipid/cholesterol/gamma-HCH transport system substrate-binding protein
MTTEAKVGAFVLACLAILGVTIVYLMAPRFGGSQHYRTYLQYAGGLEPGAPVLFGGINAGQVTAVRPWATDPTRIEVLLEIKNGTPVNEQSVAKLGSVSLMASPALMVTTGGKDSPRIPPGESIPSAESPSLDELEAKLSTIADSATGLIAQVKEELGGISGDARTLLANLNSVTGEPNQKRVRAVLDNVNGMLAEDRPKLAHIADQLSALGQHADGVVAKLGPVVDHADGTIQNINGTVSDLREPIQKDLTEVQDTLKEVKALIGNMQVLVRANDYKIGDTVDNLRVATDNLDQLTEQLKERPWSLIRTKQPKDRKVPR